jgi:ubiquinone/menaquinone biosynthesis C-methylase UbiE
MHTTIVTPPEKKVPMPGYVEELYWWAYVRPWAPVIFDHQWTVNAILLGNYNRLRNLALEEFNENAAGTTLQIGAAYGDVTPCLTKKITAAGGTLDVIDVIPNQLKNLHRKLPGDAPVYLHLMDGSALEMPDKTYDTVLLFMLLHEQPQSYREKTLLEALRVLKPRGKLVIIDYCNPVWWHPARYSSLLLYALLKPPAIAVWNNPMSKVLEAQMAGREWRQASYFGGLFQKIVHIAPLR